MCKHIGLLLTLLAISVPSYAQVGGSKGGSGSGSVTVQEEDGSPSGTASTLKFPNGSVTNNGSGSFSVATTGTPSDATYITQTSNGSLSAEQALGSLSTGCLGSATTTGVVSARTITGTANQITVTSGDCSGNPTLSIPTNPTLPGTVSATAFTATGASTGVVQMNGVTSGAFKLTTPDATGQTVTLQPAAQTSGAATFTLQDAAGVNQTIVTLAQAQTLTNKTLDAEGTGNVITIPKRLWFPAAGCNNATAGSVWDLPASNPAVAACKTGTNTQMGVLDFADSSNLSAQSHLKLPSTWTGTVDANIKWMTTATSGNVVWQLSTICVADAETDDPAFNTASTVTDTAKGTTNQTNDASITTVTVTGCAAGELMHIKIQRDSAHASDTLAATARLIGLELVIREAL